MKTLTINIVSLTFGILILITNKIVTATSPPDGMYTSLLREPVMIVAYVLLGVGIVGLVFSFIKKLLGK